MYAIPVGVAFAVPAIEFDNRRSIRDVILVLVGDEDQFGRRTGPHAAEADGVRTWEMPNPEASAIDKVYPVCISRMFLISIVFPPT